MGLSLKLIHYPLLLLLVLQSSCGHLQKTSTFPRSPDALSSCFDLFRSLWSAKPSLAAQEHTLRSLHDQAMEISADYYDKGLLKTAGLSEIEAQTLELNLKEMTGVKRGEGVPYSSHPIKLSNLSRQLLTQESDEAKQTYLYTMIHDVLEEGQGTSPDSFFRLKEKFPNSPLVADASYILVEPDIKEIPLPDNINYSMIEVVGYARQIEYFASRRKDRSLYNSSIIDKLFNLFDRYKAVNDGIVKEEGHIIRMQWRLAKQGYLLEKMQDKGHPQVVNYARALHYNLKRKLGIRDIDVTSKINEYKNLEKRFADEIDAIIEREAQVRGLLWP